MTTKAVEKESEQTTTLADVSAVAAPKKLEPVTLRSAHDFALTAQALEHRVEELKKLGKKNLEEGYHREARAIEADAAAIEVAILPQFRHQRELPFVQREQLEREVQAAIQPAVFRAFDQLGNAKIAITPSGIDDRRTRLAKHLVERITAYALDIARSSFDQGYAYREATPERLAVTMVSALRERDD